MTSLPMEVSEVARALNCSVDTVRRLERAGTLPAVKTARGVRLFAREDVERLGRARRREADDQELATA